MEVANFVYLRLLETVSVMFQSVRLISYLKLNFKLLKFLFQRSSIMRLLMVKCVILLTVCLAFTAVLVPDVTNYKNNIPNHAAHDWSEVSAYLIRVTHSACGAKRFGGLDRGGLCR